MNRSGQDNSSFFTMDLQAIDEYPIKLMLSIRRRASQDSVLRFALKPDERKRVFLDSSGALYFY
jgi:hypothetical protein